MYCIFYLEFQKAELERKASDDSIASSTAGQDSRKDRKFPKQRSFGFGRPSQAPSEVSVNLAPDRASNASLDDMGVCTCDVMGVRTCDDIGVHTCDDMRACTLYM